MSYIYIHTLYVHCTCTTYTIFSTGWLLLGSDSTEGKDAWIETSFDDVILMNIFTCFLYTRASSYIQQELHLTDKARRLSYWSASYRCPYTNCCTDPEKPISRAEEVTGHNIRCWIQSRVARSWASSNLPQWLKSLGGFQHEGTRCFTTWQQIYRRSSSGCAQSAATCTWGIWFQYQEGAFSNGEATGGGESLWLFCNHQLQPALHRRWSCQT